MVMYRECMSADIASMVYITISIIRYTVKMGEGKGSMGWIMSV